MTPTSPTRQDAKPYYENVREMRWLWGWITIRRLIDWLKERMLS